MRNSRNSEMSSLLREIVTVLIFKMTVTRNSCSCDICNFTIVRHAIAITRNNLNCATISRIETHNLYYKKLSNEIWHSAAIAAITAFFISSLVVGLYISHIFLLVLNQIQISSTVNITFKWMYHISCGALSEYELICNFNCLDWLLKCGFLVLLHSL